MAVKNTIRAAGKKKVKARPEEYSYERAAALIDRGSRMLFHWRMAGLSAESAMPVNMFVKLTQIADQLRELAADRYQTDLYFLFWSGMVRQQPINEIFVQMETSRRAFVRWQQSPPKGAQRFTITEEVKETGERIKWKIVIRLATIQRTAQLLYEAYVKVYHRQAGEFSGLERVDQTHPGITADLIFKVLNNNLG